MSADLYEKLIAHSKSNVYPFHMPGHKRGRGMEHEMPWGIDITEIEGFDNLHHAEGIIEEAQKKVAATFGADESFFVVNGSSSALMAAVMTCCKDGEKIIVGRNCHKSVFSGLVFWVWGGVVGVYCFFFLGGVFFVFFFVLGGWCVFFGFF